MHAAIYPRGFSHVPPPAARDDYLNDPATLKLALSLSCNIPFAVGHGPEKSPPGCEQPAAVMLHEPHMHLS